MKILHENDSAVSANLQDKVEEARKLLSLSDDFGFRNISGFDVITPLESAIRNLDDIRNLDTSNFSDDKADAFTSLAKSRVANYLKASKDAAAELKSNCESLLAGIALAEPILTELDAINQQL